MKIIKNKDNISEEQKNLKNNINKEKSADITNNIS